MKIHRNDTVVVISGKDASAARRAGKSLPQGIVKEVFPKTNKVVVEGLKESGLGGFEVFVEARREALEAAGLVEVREGEAGDAEDKARWGAGQG